MWKPKITWPTICRRISRSNFKPLRKTWDGVLYVLFPNTCYSCKRDLQWQAKEPLCPTCAAAIKPVGSLYCLRCGKPLPNGGAHCYQCRGSKAGHFKCKIIRSAIVFGPEVRKLIHAFKYGGQSHLALYLTKWMNQEWDKYPDLKEAQIIMPVPLYKRKQKQRGYNQSELLARELACSQGMLLDTTSLIRNRNTPSQTKLGREGRLQNMSGAFSCINSAAIKNKTILLIDDVATTGATLEGCAEALKAAGAKKVMAYTLAREV